MFINCCYEKILMKVYLGRDMVWRCVMTYCSHLHWHYCRGFNIAFTLISHFIRKTILRLGRTTPRPPAPLLSNLNGVRIFHWDSGTCWCDCCRFGSWTFLLRISFPPHPKGFLLNSDLVTAKAIGLQWTHCHVHAVNLRWLVLCNMVHSHAGRLKICKLWP